MTNSLKLVFGLFTSLLLLIGFTECKSSQGNDTIVFEKNSPFVISEIYSQDWVSGVQNGASGTKVHLWFRDIEENVEIKQFYFQGKIEDLKKSPNDINAFTANILKNKQSEILMDGNPIREAQNTPPIPFPFELDENEAVISYIINGETKFFKISEITKKPILAYPSTNNSKGID